MVNWGEKENKNQRMSEAMRRKKRRRLRIFFFCVLTAGIVFVTHWSEEVSAAEAVEEKAEQEAELIHRLYAKSAVLMDADSMRVLVEKDGETMRPMASTTKILTCILALEEGDLNAIATASRNACQQPKVHLNMQEGEQFRLKDLLYSLMLESHNDSAVVIAEHLAGSVEEFAIRMNEKAKEIGCKNAHFVTPNGLDAQDEGGIHSISAADLARIMSYCMVKSEKAEEFLEITGTKSYSFSDVSGKRNFSCGNHNLFLDMMEGAISGKTGFTGDAGYCYVGALSRDGKNFVVALLACGWPNNKNYKWADTRKLMEYGLAHYEYRNVWKDPQIVPVTVDGGIPEQKTISGDAKVDVMLDTDERELALLVSDKDTVQVKMEQEYFLKAPVEKGEEVGKVTYVLDDEVVKEYRLVTANAVQERDYRWIFREIFEKFVMCDFLS